MRDCPFCEGNKFYYVMPFSPKPIISFKCAKCGAMGPEVVLLEGAEPIDAEDAALEKWNIRPIEDRLTKMVLETEHRLRRG